MWFLVARVVHVVCGGIWQGAAMQALQGRMLLAAQTIALLLTVTIAGMTVGSYL